MLHRMNRDEHDALLREAGILDEHGDLAARYRPGEARTDKASPGPTAELPVADPAAAPRAGAAGGDAGDAGGGR
jgi:hypothetical protein